jgi:hypothetical protein
MGEACVAYVGVEKCVQNFGGAACRECHVEGRGLNVWDEIKIDRKSFRKAWTGLIWLGVGTGGGQFEHGGLRTVWSIA